MRKRGCFNIFAAGLIALGICLIGVAQGADSPEDVFWRSVRKTNLSEEYRLYTEQYPGGKYLAEARRRIAQIDGTTLRPGTVFADCTDCPEMVVIPAGSFDMGGTAFTEQPVHRVSLKVLAMGKTEVTQGQWKALMGNNPSKFAQCGDNCPVENVSWDDAQAYISKLNQKTGKTYRLPSEAEWEYACRAGEQYEYCGSDIVDVAGWNDKNSRFMTHPAASKQANAWGLYDMSGNVWEWTQDCGNATYNGAPNNGSAWTTGGCSEHSLRGGSWTSTPQKTRAAYRDKYYASYQYSDTGFRLAKNLP